MVGISLLIVAVCRGLEGLIKKGYVFHPRLVDIFRFEASKIFPSILILEDNLTDRCVTADCHREQYPDG